MTASKVGNFSGGMSMVSLIIGALLVVIGFLLYGINGFIATFAIIVLLYLLSYVGFHLFEELLHGL